MAALALGTDGGGSIRIPAAYCGLVGLKPGTGELPLPGGADEHWFGLTAPGPLARTAVDAAVMFAVLAGRDPQAARQTVEAGAAFGRVAVSLRSPSPVAELTAENRLATVGAAVLLREGGAVLAAADPPYSRATASHWSVRWQAGVAREAAELDLDLDAVEPRTATVVRHGPGRTAPGRAPPDDGRGLAGPGARLVRLRPPRRPAHPRGGGAAGAGGRHAPPGLPVVDLAVGSPACPTRRRGTWRGCRRWSSRCACPGTPVGVQLVGRPGDELALLATAARIEGREVPDARVRPTFTPGATGP